MSLLTLVAKLVLTCTATTKISEQEFVTVVVDTIAALESDVPTEHLQRGADHPVIA